MLSDRKRFPKNTQNTTGPTVDNLFYSVLANVQVYWPDVIHPPCQYLKMYRNCLLRGMIRVWGLLSNRNLYYTIPFIRAKLCNGYGSIGIDPHNAYKMQLIVLWVLIGTEKKISSIGSLFNMAFLQEDQLQIGCLQRMYKNAIITCICQLLVCLYSCFSAVVKTCVLVC